MKKKIIISVSFIIVIIICFFLFKSNYYQVSIETLNNSNLNETYALGIITTSLTKNTFNLFIYNEENSSSYYEIHVGNNNDEDTLLIGFGSDNYLNLIEKSNRKYSIVDDIIKNDNNIYIYAYKDGTKKEIVNIFKLNIRKS